MQKKLIALAIAGLASSAAFAQSNVQIYGLLDASAHATFGGDQGTTTGMNSSTYGFASNTIATSRLGFKGTEDLGNGLKGFFNLETEVALASGQMGSSTSGTGAGTFSRAANVGLDTKFGAVTLGRQATPMYAAVAGADVLGANSGGLVNAWVYSNLKTSNRIGTASTGVTNDQMASNLQNGYAAGVGYATPVFSGFQAKLFTNFGNNTRGADFENNGLQDIALSYNNAGLKLQAGHQLVKGKDYTAAAACSPAAATANTATGNQVLFTCTAADTSMNNQETEQTNDLLSASYTFGAATLSGAYVKTKFKNAAAAADDIRTYSLGGKYVLGKTTLGLSYTNTKDAEVSANKTTQIAAMADYALSKRTSAYALVVRANNDGTNTLNGIYGGAATAADDSVTSVAVGVKHAF